MTPSDGLRRTTGAPPSAPVDPAAEIARLEARVAKLEKINAGKGAGALDEMHDADRETGHAKHIHQPPGEDAPGEVWLDARFLVVRHAYLTRMPGWAPESGDRM